MMELYIFEKRRLCGLYLLKHMKYPVIILVKLERNNVENRATWK